MLLTESAACKGLPHFGSEICFPSCKARDTATHGGDVLQSAQSSHSLLCTAHLAGLASSVGRRLLPRPAHQEHLGHRWREKTTAAAAQSFSVPIQVTTASSSRDSSREAREAQKGQTQMSKPPTRLRPAHADNRQQLQRSKDTTAAFSPRALRSEIGFSRINLLLQNHISICCLSCFIPSKGNLTSASVVTQAGEEAAQKRQ